MKAFSGFDSMLRRAVAAACSALGAAVLVACLSAPATAQVPTKEELRPLDSAERGLIGQLNAERELVAGPDGLPLRRLTVSEALTQAASDYADYLRATGQFDHHADGRTAGDRAREAGFDPVPGPGLSVGEDLFEGASAEAAYSAWKGSPSHNAVLFHPDAYSVGVGRSADKWVLLVGGQCAQPRCGITAEPADPAAALAAPPRPTQLRFLQRRRGRTVSVRVRVLKGEGRVLVDVRRRDGRRARRLRVSRRGASRRYSFRLPGKGSWRATIRFRAARGWTSELVRPRPFAVRR